MYKNCGQTSYKKLNQNRLQKSTNESPICRSPPHRVYITTQEELPNIKKFYNTTVKTSNLTLPQIIQRDDIS